MTPILGRCVNSLATSCSRQTSTSQFVAQPSQHVKEYGIYCLSTGPVLQERKSIIFYKSKLTSVCEHKKTKRAFYPGRWKKEENLHFLFLCFSVSFRLDIKTRCSVWGETAVKLIGSKIFLKALVSRQLTAEEGGLIVLKRIYIYRLSCFLHFCLSLKHFIHGNLQEL